MRSNPCALINPMSRRTDRRKGAVSRVFGALTNADRRIDQFLDRQKAEKRALERRMDQMVSERTQPLESAYRANLVKNRGVFEQERGQLIERHAIQSDALKADWKTRNVERVKAYAQQERPTPDQETRVKPSSDNDRRSRADAILDRLEFEAAFKKSQQRHAPEQDNKRDRDDDMER